MLTAVVSLTILGGLFGLGLGWAARRFRVESDPVVDRIDAILPQTQCGQCNFPGCRPYAEAIAAGEAVPMPVRFRVTMPDPPPNAQSIEYGHMWSRGPTETDVENIVDSWRRQRR